MITINMGKAREIHRDRLREERAPLLAALDVEYQRAFETGDTEAMAAIVARKQALRDVTTDPAIDAATTPEQLSGIVPDILRTKR